MRAMKFRLRDLETKKIIGYEETCDAFNYAWAESGNGVDFQPSRKNLRAIREQYTGYKAKSGEVCEGDLINDNMEVYWSNHWLAWAVRRFVRRFGEGIIDKLLYRYIVDCSEDEIVITGDIWKNKQGGVNSE